MNRIVIVGAGQAGGRTAIASQGRPRRFESWDNAERQALLAADALTGREPHDPGAPPWFWTDQFDCNLQLIGLPAPSDQLHIRRGSRAHQFAHLFTRGSVLVAAALFNCGRDRQTLTRLIRRDIPIDIDLLTNSAVDLRRIA